MTPGDKIPTKVQRATNVIDSQSPPDDCIDLIEDVKGDLSEAQVTIGDDDWDAALEIIEESLGNLVALRDAILTAQQQKR